MWKRTLPLSLAAVLALTGCPKQVDVFGEEPARPGARAEAASADALALDWGAALSGANRAYAEAYARSTWIQVHLAAGEWRQAAQDLEAVRARLEDLRGDVEVPSEVRTKVRTLAPVVQTLGRLIKREDASALMLASGLVSTLQGMTADRAVLAWLGDRRAGGGAGPAPEPEAPQALALAVAPGLEGDERRYAEAYALAAWVHTQIAVGEWAQAGPAARRVVDALQAVGRGREVPAAVRQQVEPLVARAGTLGSLIARQDPQAATEAARLMASLNRLTTSPSVLAWLQEPVSEER